ncbi:hypothetical protein AAC387_Pa04g0666 [Persea americana]
MKHLQLNWILFLFACLMRWAIGPEAAATDGSVTVDVLDAVNSSCMSMALHQYYADPSRRPQTPNTACDSQKRIDEEASSGVFWLQGSAMNASRDQLIDKKLKIGVPIKNGFNEFMTVEGRSTDTHTIVKGFPIDVFDEVMALLPYNISYEFIPFLGNASSPAIYDSSGYYDSLISEVYLKEFDAVVGDVSITANRSDYVDFTYQYMEAGISMIVPVRDDDTSSPWWFMKPLTTELWATTFAFSVLKGFLIWFFERADNPDFQGSLSQIVGKVLYFSFSIFASANSEKLNKNYSRFVVNFWAFLVFVLVTSYGANLTSMLTVERLEPTITDINQLKRNGDYVGCQKGSFVFELLKTMGFQEAKLKLYGTIEEYADALSKGNDKGGVAAIVDEIPYIKVFLKNHCRNYTRPQWTHRSGGLAFVFPRGSALVADISRAVINFSEGDKMSRLEKEWFGDQTTCPDSDSPVGNKRLPLHSLRSIFITAGSASALAIFIYLTQYLYRRTKILGLIDKLMGNGLWWLILALGRYFQRSGSSTHCSQITSQSQTELELRTIEEVAADSCVIEMTRKPAEEEDQQANVEEERDASTYSEFNWKGDSMEMNMMGQTYLALFFFTIFCLCYLRIFLRQYFPRKLVEKKATGDQDVKSEIEMMLLTIIILLILGIGNFGSQLERGIFKSTHKFKGNHFSTTIFAMVVNFPYKVSGEFSPYENHGDNKEYYDELNGKNGKTDMKLRILIPTINTFHEFVRVDRDPKGNGTIVTGYSVEVFKEVMHSLPYPVSYELFPYEGIHSLDMGYYDELIRQLHLKRYDGVVGDVTFTYNRSKSGDFTMPYMTSGLSMIVPNAASHAFSLWWFLEPFTWGLWLLIIALFLSGGLLVWIFEHESNIECKGTFREQVGLILSFCFSIFVFERWEMPRSKSSRMVVIVGILVMLVLGVSYSAKLQARLSIDNDRPTGVEQLIMNGDCVGYQKGSFVFYLLKRMGFQEEKLKAYTSEEYATALSRGSHYNGVSAIVDEIPYIKVFLAKYPDQFTMAELPFSSGGFAFVFLSLFSVIIKF